MKYEISPFNQPTWLLCRVWLINDWYNDEIRIFTSARLRFLIFGCIKLFNGGWFQSFLFETIQHSRLLCSRCCLRFNIPVLFPELHWCIWSDIWSGNTSPYMVGWMKFNEALGTAQWVAEVLLWYNFSTTAVQLWYKFSTTIEQLWSVEQLWYKAEIALAAAY